MKKKLLLADGTGELKAIGDLLKGRDIEVLHSPTAEHAFRVHEDQRADIIIADLELPEMGGDKLCSMIRETEEFSSVYFFIVCSGRNADLERCGKCGANSYLNRPFDLENIVERISRILEAPGRATRVLVKATVQGMFKSEPFYCLSHNLSVSGILLETDKILAKGDVISGSFYLPDYERVNAEGVVVRMKKVEGKYLYQCGVEFTSIEPEDRRIISEFVREQRELGNFL